MKLIDRYIAFEWARWTGICTFFIISVLFIQSTQEKFDLLLTKENSMLAEWFLSYFPWIFPIGCFLGTILTLIKFSLTRELLGMRSL